MNSDLSHVTTSWVQNILMRITQGVERVSEPFVHTVGLPRAIFAFVLGALSAAAYAPVYFLPAFIVSFTGLIWLCDGLAARRARLRQVFCVGWMFGFGQFLFGLYWIGRAFLVDADTFAWMLPFVAVAMPGGLALFSGAAVMLCVRFWTFGVHRIALFTFVWMGAEWLRGHILTGFPWNLPGYVWGDTLSVAQSTSVIGSYGLSLVTIFACSALAVLVSTRAGRPQWSPRAWIVPLLVWGGFAALAALGSMRVANTPYEAVEGIGLRIVQPSFDQDEKWKPENRFHILKTYLEMSALETTQADELNITHVIWPESATPFLLARDAGALAAVARTLKEGQLLLTGAPRAAFSETGDARYFNSFQVIDHTGSIIAVYDKHHLVPFGETLPFSDILNRLGVTKLVGGLGSFTRGPGPVTLSVPGTPAFSPLICYEVIFPEEILAETRPQWLLNVTNDAWYGNSAGPYQHFAQARFRAIEQGLPLVRSANTGISAVIDPVGRIWQRLVIKEFGAIDSKLPRALEPTVYARIGDSVFLSLLLILLIWRSTALWFE